MLAYLFWHRPAADVEAGGYEEALVGFHRSLAHRPPDGFRGSASFRAGELPWLAGGAGGYEDWYLVDGWSSLGVLDEAATARGHRTAHDRAARGTDECAGGVLGLIEGRPLLIEARVAVWVDRARGDDAPEIGALLGDGMPPDRGSLWQRRMVLGAAPEFCLLGPEAPPGVRPDRLPRGWRGHVVARELLWFEP